MLHAFANRTNKKTRMLNFKITGGSERILPDIEEWFLDTKISSAKSQFGQNNFVAIFYPGHCVSNPCDRMRF